jgi:hypothetical protein
LAGVLVVAPTGIDPVTFRFSVGPMAASTRLLASFSAKLRGFWTLPDHCDDVGFGWNVGKMWANSIHTERCDVSGHG